MLNEAQRNLCIRLLKKQLNTLNTVISDFREYNNPAEFQDEIKYLTEDKEQIINTIDTIQKEAMWTERQIL